MGEVYRAEDPRLGRQVAIKVLPEEVADDSDLLHRLEKEAKAAGALNHPNILVVYDTGTHEDAPYVVTELLEGDTLRERMGGAALPARKAVEYGVQIARGLAAAHDKGIVHRDIKPENLFVTHDGLVKILDFGLAKVLPPRPPFKESEDTPRRGPTTEPGRIMGTVDYMSPEQVRARSVDHRADLFSFGTVLYEMLSGHPPFRGETPADTMTAILTRSPPEPSALDWSVPKVLDRIVFRCLEKLPEDRFQSARDLASDLDAVSEATGARRGRHRWAWAAAAFVAALALTVAYLRPRPEARPSFEAQPTLSESARARMMLVVLPFENLGAPEDAYFAAGMTEEITSRLARVSGLGVTSRTTATQYDRVGKTVKEIGEDLGVGFVLEGTVRWDRRAEGAGRVRITPQLIRVADDTHLWADSYERELDDIFAIQSGIAQMVVSQLGATLLPDEQQALDSRPTESMEAYQAYLMGVAQRTHVRRSPESVDVAVQMFERAVAHDPSFVEAYAQLARDHLFAYWMGWDRTPERLAKARQAVDRALELAPDSPEAHFALGLYNYWALRDYEGALAEFTTAGRLRPNDVDIASYTHAVLRRQGRWQEAVATLEGALALDPQNPSLLYDLAESYGFLRRYVDAQRMLDTVISLAPDMDPAYALRAWGSSLAGSLDQARRTLKDAPRQDHDSVTLRWITLDYWARDYDSALHRLTEVPDVRVYSEEVVPRTLREAWFLRLQGEQERAQPLFEAARVFLGGWVEERPKDWRARRTLAWAYAGLGRKGDAIREAKRASELLPISRDAVWGPMPRITLAQVYATVGEHDAAIEEVEYLLSIPAYFSVWELRLDPVWDPLREHPRFKKLVGENWQAEVSP
jgi:TolB-like protein/Flp pilus assembly protein TadD